MLLLFFFERDECALFRDNRDSNAMLVVNGSLALQSTRQL